MKPTICQFCGEKRKIQFYASNKSRCRTCAKKYQRHWQTKNKQRYLAYLDRWRTLKKKGIRMRAGLPHCQLCGERNPDQFVAQNKSCCVTCRKRYHRAYVAKHKDQLLAYWRKYHHKDRDRRNASRRKNAHLQTRLQKLQVLQAYGGKCECCGETRWALLTIEHKRNDGSQDRRNNFYKRLIQRGCPKNLGLGVLCYNCNCSKGHFRICPHKDPSKFLGLSVARALKKVAA
jgi:hypothetical protein